jgi:outer membrane protein OmpA-like peptidoglycan-associated protein
VTTLRALTFAALAVVVVPAAGLAQEADVEGSKDHPLFTRMPGYYISRYEEKDFEVHSFWVGEQEVPVEGRLTNIRYAVKSGAKEATRLQILRNYEAAITKIGGKVTRSDYDGSSFLKVTKTGKEIWVHVDAYITSEWGLWIVEKAAMKQDVTANADAWRDDIARIGRAVVYGILFDTDQATLKPESSAVLREIATLLSRDPSLNLLVVGHTDMTGEFAHNVKLSEDRAAAVVAALVGTHGVAAGRLKAYGVGPLAPVASNGDEDGRAKNRRVELVKR